MQELNMTAVQRLFTGLMEASYNRINGHAQHLSRAQLKTGASVALESTYRMGHADAIWLGGALVEYAERLTTPARPIDSSVEAVQIEWISNGILVRGKGADGAFCNYYRDTSAFVSQHLNGKTFDFVKGKEPKTGDKCVVYFGIADTDTE